MQDPKLPNPLNSLRQDEDLKIVNDNFVIQPLGESPMGGGDMHESFNVDKDGNISGGHTTTRLPGGQSKKVDW